MSTIFSFASAGEVWDVWKVQDVPEVQDHQNVHEVRKVHIKLTWLDFSMQKGSACRATGKASHSDNIVDVFVICLLNSTDDIAAYAICFDFCYYHQPSQTGQNSSRVNS